MAVLNKKKLAKLTLKAFRSVEDKIPFKEFKCDFNPSSLDLSATAQYDSYSEIGQLERNIRAVSINPNDLTLQLFIDQSELRATQSVSDRISDLYDLCFKTYIVNNKKNTPFIKVNWGSFKWLKHDTFSGRAVSMRVNYTLFNKSGAPQRANITLQLQADASFNNSSLSNVINNTNSDGVFNDNNSSNQFVMVNNESSLMQLLAKHNVPKQHYLDIARDNNMDNLDQLRAGQLIKLRNY